MTGTYQWNASYSGDGNNNAVSDNNAANEQVAVSPASPTISTTPSLTPVTLGTSSVTLTDTAVLAGGYNPTGTITFTLFTTAAASVDTETVTVNGNGTYTTPTGFTLPTSAAVTGTYQWDASYSGDANNNATTTTRQRAGGGQRRQPDDQHHAQPDHGHAGHVGGDADRHGRSGGGYHPTGTITFTLVYNGGSRWTRRRSRSTATAPTRRRPASRCRPHVTGTYQWNATYSGDGNNNPASDNNAANEQVTVSAASPTITTTPSRTVMLGTALS